MIQVGNITLGFINGNLYYCSKSKIDIEAASDVTKKDLRGDDARVVEIANPSKVKNFS